MLNELFLKRQSCRNFDGDREVERDKIERIMENVRLSPSACNSQPYSFIAVTTKKLAEKIAKTTQGMGMNRHCSAVRCFIVVVEEDAGLLAKTGARLKDQQLAEIDIGIAAAHLVLSAEEEGLSTCILGWFDENKIKELLAIDKSKRVRLVIATGYASPEDKLRDKKRKPLEKLISFK